MSGSQLAAARVATWAARLVREGSPLAHDALLVEADAWEAAGMLSVAEFSRAEARKLARGSR